jgi:glucosamine--fructose-6-phosphate aminotransferase (isomerizing)
MHRHVHAQPATVAEVAERTREQIDHLAAEIAGYDRLFLVGIGTSWHAALGGAEFMRVYGGGLPAIVMHSFDFVEYGPALTARDCVVVISHTARKSYSVSALERVRATDALPVLLTGQGGDEKHPWVRDAIITTPQEQSATYTFSYTAALTALALLAERIGFHRAGLSSLSSTFFTDDLPAALAGSLTAESEIEALAREQLRSRRIWLTGGGPSAITAQEVALKIKEAAYLMAEGIPTEQLFHGPFQCADPQDLFVLIAPSGPAQDRTLQLAGPIHEIGSRYLLISDGTAGHAADNAIATIAVPPVPEPFTALTCLLPLHLFAYHLALAAGTNPDRFRLDNERFARAFALNRL